MAELRDLEIRHLLALDAVATEGTFGRAAERLGYTQSAISQQIASFERIVGEPLFDRPGGPRPVELTPLGEMLLAHARDLLGRIDGIVDDIGRFRAGAVGRLDIGTFQSVSVGILPGVIRSLRNEQAALETRPFESDHNDELIARVIDGDLDLSFLIGDIPGELDSVVLCHDPFVVVALPDDVDHRPVSTIRLGTVALIGQQDNACHRMMDNGLRAAGCEPSYVFRTNDNSAVVAMVRAGMGMAVLPLLAVDPHDDTIAVRAIDPPIPDRVIRLAWKRGRTLSPAERRFIELTIEACADLEQRNAFLQPARRRRGVA